MIVVIAAYAYLRFFGFHKLYHLVLHSGWWLGLSEAKKDLVSGILLTGLGGLGLRRSLEEFDEHSWNLFSAFCTGLVVVWGLYELFEAIRL